MPALSNKNQREIRRLTTGIITYGKQGQGHRRGDEQETWRRRLLFTTARRNPSAPTTATTTPHHGDEHAAPRRTSVAFSAGLIVSNRGGGETGEVKTGEDWGICLITWWVGCKYAIGSLLLATPGARTGSRTVNRWSTGGVRCVYGAQ